jgi:glutaredoxin-like YruB-family protein
LQEIHSFAELEKRLREHERLFLLLYKKGNDSSECAFTNIRDAVEKADGPPVFYADVNRVRDIHPQYRITSVPSLLEFGDRELKNVIRGCNDNGHYRNFFDRSGSGKETPPSGEKTAKRVTVYSTPSCPWCNTLKNYLREHRIAFRDTDISRDMRAAEDLVRRSGQRGVPQTDINGKIVVGFDKARLNELLDIKG